MADIFKHLKNRLIDYLILLFSGIFQKIIQLD